MYTQVDLINENNMFCVCGHSAYYHEIMYKQDEGFDYGPCLEHTQDNTIGPPTFSVCNCKKFQLHFEK